MTKTSALRDPLRSGILVLFGLGSLGLIAELLLLEHTEEWAQRIPLLLLSVGLALCPWLALGRQRLRLWLFELLCALYLAGGVTGLWQHYQSNVEFELEMDASLEGLDLMTEALAGATPALAPAAVIFLGILGLLYTFRHPDLEGAP